jgi:ATP-dependent exoDNAse (exonuclease V) beta subunit
VLPPNCLPFQERIEIVSDDANLREVYDTERNLLYVACTRARDHLLVTSVEPASEFIDDMQGATKPVSGSSDVIGEVADIPNVA